MKWLAALAVVLVTGPATAQYPPVVCNSRDVVVEKLWENFHERPVAMGLHAAGTVIEVYSTKDYGGSWTITVTDTNGRTCLLAEGSSWEPIPFKAPSL